MHPDCDHHHNPGDVTHPMPGGCPPMGGVPLDEANCLPHEPKPKSMSSRKELMTLAMGIAAQVQATVKPGRDRCLLRQMVEMFLDN